MIRKAKPSDLAAIVDLGLEGMATGAYPGLVVSRAKLEDVARQCVSAAQNFCWVAERDGKVCAAVSAIVHECVFHTHKQMSIVQFYSRAPGEGIKLMREALRWGRSRPTIKVITFTLEVDADPRIGKLLSRLGLNAKLPVYSETR